VFEAIQITKQTLVNNLTKFFDQYGLRDKIIAYVKDEGSNLNNMIIVLKFVMKCDESFEFFFCPFFPQRMSMCYY
jgi:hypothetical protein